MGDKLDTVFVSSRYWTSPPDMSTLEWVFRNFDKDKTKIIVIEHYPSSDHQRHMFINAAQSYYLPRCRRQQFKAEMLIPQAYRLKEATLELLTKHGMKKMVINKGFFSLLPELAPIPNPSCKVWSIDDATSKLESIRLFGPDPELLEARMEVEKFKRIADEETIKRKNIEEKLIMMNMSLSTYITFQELDEATQNFSDSLKIGEGGSGSVYRGSFRSIPVAIKKLTAQNEKALADFRKEVVILSTVRHPNLVTLMGACSDPPVLVYEYLSNKSLHDHLNHTGRPLYWQTRTRIIGEICLALIYLHSNKPDPIVHGDLKPDNVFLDANFTSKLSDFGLIKQAYTNTANLFRTTNPERTFAYIDPRFLKTGKMTKESDVYSLGVIILRLVTGKSPLDIRETVEDSMVNNQFPSMIDESAGKWPLQHAEELAKIGIRCAHDSWTKRPDLVNEVWPVIEALLKFPE